MRKRPSTELTGTYADDHSDHDTAELRRLRRSDRLAFWGLVAGVTFVVMGLVYLGVVVGLSPARLGILGGVVGVGIAKFVNGRSGYARQRRQTSKTQRDRTDVGGRRFSNFAFSQTLPTWHGWRRDVGDVVIDSNGMTINGLKHRVQLRAPLSAKLYAGRKWTYWTMVEVSGVSAQGQEMVVYLIAEGAPRSKFSADPDDLHRRGEELVRAIRSAFP